MKALPLNAAHFSGGSALSARTSAPDNAAAEFMVFPGGEHTIHCGQGTKDVSVRILINKESATAFEAQRKLLTASTAHRPYFDFDHDNRSASFWPSEFLWRDSPAGVYARGEWSEGGRKAIEGKDYRSFSPKFHVDDVKANPAKVICYAKAALNMGGFVNDPAFKNNLPLWAKAGAPGINTNHTTMTKEEKAALQAQRTTLEGEIAVLEGQAPSVEQAEAILSKRNQVAVMQANEATVAMQEENDTLKLALFAGRKRDAEAAVKAAVARGAIATKDSASQEMWLNMATDDPSKLALIAGLRGSPALQQTPRPFNMGSIHMTRESSHSILSGLSVIAAKNRGENDHSMKRSAARDFAALYAREILPRLKEGDDIPLAGANSLGTLVSSLVSTRTLELLTLDFPVIKSIFTDFSDQIVNYGDTLTTHVTGIPGVVTYNQTTGWAKSFMTSTPVPITYDQKKGVDIAIDDQSLNSTVRRLFDEIAPAQAYALAKDIVDYVYGKITLANFPVRAAAAGLNPVNVAGLANFARTTLIDVGGSLDDAGNPAMGRTFLANRPYYSALKKDQTLITLSQFQSSQMNMITKGVINDVEDFTVVKAVNFPNTVIGAAYMKGFGFTRSALCVASRLSADYMNILPGAGNGNLTVITTPSGFSANQVQYVDNVLASANQRLEIIYGAAPGQPAAGVILTGPILNT